MADKLNWNFSGFIFSEILTIFVKPQKKYCFKNMCELFFVVYRQREYFANKFT